MVLSLYTLLYTSFLLLYLPNNTTQAFSHTTIPFRIPPTNAKQQQLVYNNYNEKKSNAQVITALHLKNPIINEEQNKTLNELLQTLKKIPSKLSKMLTKLPSDIPTASTTLYQTLSFNGTTEELVGNITYYCDSMDKKKMSGDEKGFLTLGVMKFSRYCLLNSLLRRDYVAYVETATFFNNRIPRRELPNVQDIPYLDALNPSMPIYDTTTTDENEIVLLPDCALPNITFLDNILDDTLLYIFRKLVEKNSDYEAMSSTRGIEGLLEQGRSYMVSGATEERQHRMVQDTLRDLMGPIVPIYRFFMSGIIPPLPDKLRYILDDDFYPDRDGIPKSDFDKNRYNFFNFGGGGEKKANYYFDDTENREENQFGPFFYAPYFTTVVTPIFFKFLVGPSSPNMRMDGKPGGLLVEKCKFLQESGCKGLCLHQCKLPAQQFFKENLGMDLTVSPNFVTQECQWSFGEKPLAPEDDPSFPKGCLVGCTSRSFVVMEGDDEDDGDTTRNSTMRSNCG